MDRAASAPAIIQGRTPAAVWVVLGTLIVTAVVVILAPSWGPYAAPPVLALGHATAGWLLVTRSRRLPPPESRAWRLVGVGLVIGSVGVVAVAVATLVDDATTAFGPTDLFFIVAYAITLAGLWRLPHLSTDASSRARLLLDGLIGGVSIAALLWVSGLDELVQWGPDTPTWTVVVGSLYPLIDLAAFVVVMIVIVRRSAFRFDPRLVLLAAATVLQAAADIHFLDQAHVAAMTGSTAFRDVQPLFPAFLLASAAFLGTGILLDRRPPQREYADRKAPWWTLIAPYSAAALLIVALIVEVTGESIDQPALVLLYATLTVGALVIARQTIAIRENRVLVERQRAALVSSISHELRTPLTAMVGFLEVLDEMGADLPAEERAEMMSVVRQQGAYMTRIVTDLVMLARGSLDQMHLDRHPEDLSRIALAAIAAVDGGADGTELVVDGVVMAEVDGDRIQQAVVNLITNAIRYGGSHRVVRLARSGSDLLLEVHDDGPGVPKKYELSIWERFERGPNRLNATVPGSGIGLAVVDAIARSHGGATSYRPSELLGGACFCLTIPGAVMDGVEARLPVGSPAVAG